MKVKLDKAHRIWIYTIFSLIWISGITFFVLQTWFQVEGEFGMQKHPFQFTSLQIHGLAAFLMMVTYGYLLGTHVKAGWKIKPLRRSGVLLTIIPAFMMVTAYLLYYIAQDLARQIIAYSHLAVGFLIPFILVIHVVTIRRQKKINRQARVNK